MNKNIYIQTVTSKDIKAQEEILKREGLPFYVYFEQMFFIYYIGFSSLDLAKKEYKHIMAKKNLNLYGCVLSVESVV